MGMNEAICMECGLEYRDAMLKGELFRVATLKNPCTICGNPFETKRVVHYTICDGPRPTGYISVDDDENLAWFVQNYEREMGVELVYTHTTTEKV